MGLLKGTVALRPHPTNFSISPACLRLDSRWLQAFLALRRTNGVVGPFIRKASCAMDLEAR
jgi:hypothetical protein